MCKSMSAMLLIVAVSLFMCVLWASLITITDDKGVWIQMGTTTLRNGLELVPLNERIVIGQYIRPDMSESYFVDMLESWWWCLQTLTSEGYGVPWAPVTDGGKMVAVIAALAGTIILALPIAVVGVTFDDEWVKQVRADHTSPHLSHNPLRRAHSCDVNMNAHFSL